MHTTFNGVCDTSKHYNESFQLVESTILHYIHDTGIFVTRQNDSA